MKWLRAGYDEPRECTKCGDTKPADEFAERKPGRYRRRECRLCWQAAAAARYPNGRGPPAKAKKAWIERNKEKRRAQNAANNAVREGKLTKDPCEVCATTTHVHGHHDDYSKPLKVRWLCAKHHTEHHLNE